MSMAGWVCVYLCIVRRDLICHISNSTRQFQLIVSFMSVGSVVIEAERSSELSDIEKLDSDNCAGGIIASLPQRSRV